MKDLETRIAEELESIDVDSRYDDFLDDVYPDLTIAGMSFSTSRALKELDPTAYRCGMNDWIDSENFVEINGDYYDADDCERIKDEMLSEIESRIEAVEEEISEEEDSDEPCEEDLKLLKERLAELETEAQKLTKHIF